jgi:hypothetical protein
MVTHTTWSNWIINHASNNAGNQNLLAFSNILSSNNNDVTKLWQLVEEIETDILAADSNNCIMILHSPKNSGGTQTRPKNKVVCILGMGTQAVSALVDLNLALANCSIIVPTINKLSGCATLREQLLS